MTDIKNKTAFVTGAASGIGYALAEGLLKRGAKVMLVDIDEAGLKAAQDKLGHDNTAISVCDVADPDAVKALSQELAEAGISVSCLCPTWVKSNIHNTPDKAPVAGQYREKFKASKAYETIKGYMFSATPLSYLPSSPRRRGPSRVHFLMGMRCWWLAVRFGYILTPLHPSEIVI